MQKFSVIIPVYKSDNPEYLTVAFSSIINQTRVPDEIIIIVDGPIDSDLNNIIKNLTYINEVIVIMLEQNQGPGAARHEGILKSKNNIIALMDADDISNSNRFEKELDALAKENVDAVGGWIEEFESTPGDLNQVRITPKTNEEIVLLSKWRMPVNHVTVVFKKEAYFSVGGYKSMRYAEDFNLISRMLSNGFKFHNIQEVLVNVRVGNDMYNRRRGISFMFAEMKVFRDMRSSGYINTWQYICNIIIRVLIRLLPSRIISSFYMKLFRSKHSTFTR